MDNLAIMKNQQAVTTSLQVAEGEYYGLYD